MTDLLARPHAASEALDTRPPDSPAAATGGSETVVAVVAHARSVSSKEREAFAERLASLADDEGSIVVHTCHRVELYRAPGSCREPALPPLPEGAEVLSDVGAARHLIEVACGLDSAVIGEDQILHQVRETLTQRHAAGPVDPVLDRLFQVALHAGRQAHTWFSGSPRSLADVALDRLTEATGPSLHGRTVLVVGVGRMGRLAAFAARRRGARILISNRTGLRADALAHEVDGTVVPWGEVPRSSPLDGVVLAIGGAWQVDLEGTVALLESGVTVVDLSSPPAVDDGLRRALKARYVSVDDLADRPDVAIPERLRRRLDRLVSESGREYCRWLRGRDVAPAIQAMAASAEEHRRTETAWLLRRLPELGTDERALVEQLVEQMSHRLVAGLMHAPMAALNADADGDLERAARELFRL